MLLEQTWWRGARAATYRGTLGAPFAVRIVVRERERRALDSTSGMGGATGENFGVGMRETFATRMGGCRRRGICDGIGKREYCCQRAAWSEVGRKSEGVAHWSVLGGLKVKLAGGKYIIGCLTHLSALIRFFHPLHRVRSTVVVKIRRRRTTITGSDRRFGSLRRRRYEKSSSALTDVITPMRRTNR